MGNRLYLPFVIKLKRCFRLETVVARLAGHIMELIQIVMLRPDVVERLTAHQLRTRFEQAIDGSPSPLLSSIHRMPSRNANLPQRTSSSYDYHTIVAGLGAAANSSPQRSVKGTTEPSVSGDRIPVRCILS